MSTATKKLISALIAAIVVSFNVVSGEEEEHNKKFLIDAPLLTSKLHANRTLIVDQNGKGEFTSVQKAVDAVPDGNAEWIIVHVRKGVYREKVVIPKAKTNIFMRGNGKGKSLIVWDDSSDDNTASSTFSVFANNFVAFGLGITNDAPPGEAGSKLNKSVAVMASGDKVAFYHCAFYSTHNTLFDNRGRHYYESCYIQGTIDFIFGRAQTIFQSCEIFVVGDKRLSIVGSITAQNRHTETDNSGYVFSHGKVYGVEKVYLGRPKTPFSRVIFNKMYMSKTVVPEGWTDWNYNGAFDHVSFGERECYGPGAGTAERVPWSKQLSPEEATSLTDINFINGDDWLPAYYHHV